MGSDFLFVLQMGEIWDEGVGVGVFFEESPNQ